MNTPLYPWGDCQKESVHRGSTSSSKRNSLAVPGSNHPQSLFPTLDPPSLITYLRKLTQGFEMSKLQMVEDALSDLLLGRDLACAR